MGATLLTTLTTLVLYASTIIGTTGQLLCGLSALLLKFATISEIKSVVSAAFGPSGVSAYILTISQLSGMVRHGALIAQDIAQSNMWLRLATSKALWQQVSPCRINVYVYSMYSMCIM